MRLEQTRHDIRSVVAIHSNETQLAEMKTVPHGSLVLSLQFGEALGSDEGGRVNWCKDALTGLRTQPTKYLVRPGTRALVAMLSPRAATLLLGGLPMSHLAARRVPLDDLLPGTTRRELQDLLPEPTKAAAGVLAAWLEERLLTSSMRMSHDAQRTFVVAEMARRAAINTVEELERFAGVSRRQCERDFMRWIGVSPKQMLELNRLQRTLQVLRQQQSALVASAAQQGFADQSHMTRTVRRLTGVTPSVWSKLALSDVGSAYARAMRGELITT